MSLDLSFGTNTIPSSEVGYFLPFQPFGMRAF